MFIDILQLNGVPGVRGGPGAVVPSSVEQVRGRAQDLVTPTTLVRKDWNVLVRRLMTVFVTTVKVSMYINMLELQIIDLPKMLHQGHNCLYNSPVGVVQDCLDGDGEGLSDSLKSIFIFLLLHTFFT